MKAEQDRLLSCSVTQPSHATKAFVMSMTEESERSISQSERHILDLERHIQDLEAAGLRALGLHEKIQAVLETKRETLRTKRETLRTLQTTAAVRPDLD